MPEGTEETATQTQEPQPEAPAAPEPQHVPPAGAEPPPAPAEAEPAEPEAAGGPDLTDANTQLREIREGLQQAGVLPNAEPGATTDYFLGRGTDDYYDDEPYDQQAPEPQGEQQLTDEQRFTEGLLQQAEERAERRMLPYLQEIEMERRRADVQRFIEGTPLDDRSDGFDPKVLKAVDRILPRLDPNFGRQEGYVPSPEHLRIAFNAAQYELAAETSPGPEGQGQDTAEAVGQNGVPLERGAGPGAPEPPVDPYIEALSSGRKPNRFGL